MFFKLNDHANFCHKEDFVKDEMLQLMYLLLAAVACQAGLLYPEVPITSAITNVHSPTAISHQSITHIHTKDPQLLVKPSDYILAKEALPTHHKESTHLDNIVLSSIATSAENEEFDYIKSSDFDTASTSISYKDNTPVLTSYSHTPAHLTYAARPIVYKMLPHHKSSVLNRNLTTGVA
ncbi:hypothetical protein FF38_09547 [Lucilia cuprina]|uniref:Uncharacterized protein n=1 Tax=Lucilia cuprina TaxID=7375 RepID=A0A0L0CF24_LUCCU|nr:hypothetical protein FF38_09547 [Lucilia cuprina]